MRLKNLAALPFAFVADAATLGNIGGGRSFTQQVFDRDRAQDETEALIALAEVRERLRAYVESRPTDGKS